ncbi:hypothetical protein JCM5350_003883 [Sporobolomyces pararoseus]
MSTSPSPAEQILPHSQVQALVPKFEKCTTQAQFRKVLFMVNGRQARLSCNKDSLKTGFADWKRDLLRDLSTAISRSANGFESQQKQKKGGSKFKLEFETISWISCGRSLQAVVEEMQEAQIKKTNWTLTKLFTRLIGDEHLALRNEIIEAQEKKKVDVDLIAEFPSPIELWEAANALRPEHLRLDSASEAHSLRRLLNRRQRLIYGF